MLDRHCINNLIGRVSGVRSLDVARCSVHRRLKVGIHSSIHVFGSCDKLEIIAMACTPTCKDCFPTGPTRSTRWCNGKIGVKLTNLQDIFIGLSVECLFSVLSVRCCQSRRCHKINPFSFHPSIGRLFQSGLETSSAQHGRAACDKVDIVSEH